MRKPDQLFPVLAILALPMSPLYAQAADFTLCQGTYALCTTARCTPVPGNDATVSCACEVKTGYSAGRSTCKPPKDTQAGKQVQSRYYPVKSISVCSNDRAWADCLGKPCTVDKDDPAKATCMCATESDKGPYVIVGTTYTPSTCTTGIVSSATFADNKGISRFLRSTGKLEPFPIKVVNDTHSERRFEPSGSTPAE